MTLLSCLQMVCWLRILDFMLGFLINYITLMLREGNKVTHNLARHALCISDFVVWMEDVSPPLLPVILVGIAKFS